MTICPASVPVMVELCPAAQQANGEQQRGHLAAQHRIEQFVGRTEIDDLGHAAAMERRSGGDQDRGVQYQGKRQRGVGIADVFADRTALGWYAERPT